MNSKDHITVPDTHTHTRQDLRSTLHILCLIQGLECPLGMCPKPQLGVIHAPHRPGALTQPTPGDGCHHRCEQPGVGGEGILLHHEGRLAGVPLSLSLLWDAMMLHAYPTSFSSSHRNVFPLYCPNCTSLSASISCQFWGSPPFFATRALASSRTLAGNFTLDADGGPCRRKFRATACASAEASRVRSEDEGWVLKTGLNIF